MSRRHDSAGFNFSYCVRSSTGGVMKEGKKPFFFRIDISGLFDFATDPEGLNMSLLQFAKELQKEKSDIPYIQGLIEETREFITKKSAAGKKGMENRWLKNDMVITNDNTDIAVLSTDITNDNTPVTRSSNRNKKEKIFRVPSGPHQFFIAWWVMAFEKVTNQKPSITGRTGKQVQEMLGSVSLKHLICYSAIVLTSDDDFYQKAGRTLSVLQSQLDSFKSRRNEYDIEGWRELGLLPPAEIPIEDWKFWEPNND